MSKKNNNEDGGLDGFVNFGFNGHEDGVLKKDRSRENSEGVDLLENRLKPLPYYSLFQYSTPFEKACIAVAVLFAILSGCIPPVVNVLYGEFCNLMIDRQYPTDAPSTKTFLLEFFGGGRILQNASDRERRIALEEDSVAWGIGCACLTFIQFLLSMISVFLLSFMAYQQVSRIKVLFFKSVLCKDLSWFDTTMDGNFAGQVSENLILVQKGLSDILSLVVFWLVVGLLNILICFIVGWLLSILLAAFIFPLFFASLLKGKFQSQFTMKEMESRTKAGNVAEEVFSSIRTVVAFEGEEKEIERFSESIELSKTYGIKRGLSSGITNGLSWFLIYCSYAVAFVFGVRFIESSKESGNDDYTPAILLIVFFGVVTALTNFGFASTHIETFSVACGAAASVFNVINTKSKINPCSGDGDTNDVCFGEIEFRDVHFEYPARPSAKILRGVNLKIKAGEVVAIVGGSGAGKSTILQLVQRLYDPSAGDIFLDGRNIKSLKISWLRQQLGIVAQEPQLFNTTIRDNICYGHFSHASDNEVQEAAKKANAHNFIMELKDGYDTVIGQKGSTLSGGQKQRIVIARTLIRNPKILLLDEATSALDASSEKIVQEALNTAAQGRTTLIVTHKLSSVEKADRIVVLNDGVIAEEGTHKELVAANGIYRKLLQKQTENIKDKKLNASRVRKQVIIQDDTLSLPPVPRGRLSSVSSLTKTKAEKRLETGKIRKVNYYEIWKWSKPEICFLILGFLASLICGAALPIVCIFFGNLFGLLSLTDSRYIIQQTDTYAICVLLVGIAAGISVFLQIYCFSMVGIRLSSRLRIKAFQCIIRQEIGFFDDEKNKVGALCLRLSEDPSQIQNSIGIRLGIFMQAFSTMTIGIVSSFFFNWKITLVTLATLPFVFTGVYLESIFGESLESGEIESMETASKIAVEVISNIKAVASLSKEFFFVERYAEALKAASKINFKKSWLRGFAFATGQTAPFFGYAISLWYGGLLVARENLHYKYVLMVSELLIFGAWTLGQSVVLGPSYKETKAAASRLNYIFQRRPKITGRHFPPSDEEEKNSSVRYSEVNFSYPTSPGTNVLNDFNLHVKAGQSVGVMGPSGSGKSTIIQLLLRYYDPTSGVIDINNVNIAQYKLSYLRKRIGLVSQEPVLFDRTIQENIAYGDNSRVVPLSEIIDAAVAANIHSFITTLPLGYDTRLGVGGAQLSGGQKQRIAIARALVRQPQILLLDEATSALDAQSEDIVQDALDNASVGTTTITVAHRFGAVRKADIIYVVEKGRVKEFGSHNELMSLHGLYYSMYTEEEGDDKNKPQTSKK